jgi:hypothetical protein
MGKTVNTAVLVLAAGSIKNKYRSFSFLYDSPALIPVASRSCCSFILDFYSNQPVKLYLVINEKDKKDVANDLSGYHALNIISVTETVGINDTLQQALEQIKEDSVIINLVTTIPVEYPQPDTVYIDKSFSQNEYYSGFIFKNNKITFKRKGDGNESKFQAFTGVFRTGKKAIQNALKKVKSKSDLLEVVQVLQSSAKLKYEAIEWIDLGHEINYADARKKLLSSRVFNAISVNNNSGTLKKKSRNKVKLANEIKYIAMLPGEFQLLYPRIVSANAENGEAEMEYYGYPNLSEYQLYRTIEPSQWEKAFSLLQYIIEQMKTHRFSIGKNTHMQFYYSKTNERIAQFKKEMGTEPLVNKKEVVINGLPCKNFEVLRPRVLQRIEKLYNEEDFSIMHGDLCFNNILFDIFSNTLKLIDPRGSFGENCVGIYGDIKYDIAKLLHSSVSHYDYIVNNLFRYKEGKNEVQYSFPLRENAALLESLSLKLVKHLGYDRDDLMFIVGLLFLSMCPLHPGNTDRQKLMYFHGIYLINKHL